jgi:TRAP-type C4-dicarboxylate transport system substrate-binding protein
VTYGAHRFHRFHTLTSHFYVSRPIFIHRASFDAWPPDLQRAMREATRDAIAFQRDLAIEEEEKARAAIEREHCTIAELEPREHEQFAAAVKPLMDEARDVYGRDALRLAGAG